MSILHRLARRWRALTRRGAVERELSDELRFHLEMEQAKNERAGMPPDEARRAALVTFGGVERYKEEARDVRGVRVMETAAQDLRYALRAMRKAPGFTLMVVLTLGLGVGATSAIFSIVNGVLLRPLPFGRDAELVRVYSQVPDGTVQRFSVSIPDYLDFKSRNRVFSDMTMWVNSTMTLQDGGEPERLAAVAGAENLFSVFGIRAQYGRLFLAGDADRADVIVLSYGLWARRFGADPAVVGRRLTIDGSARTVVGVLPASFRLYTRDVDVWAPVRISQLPKYENRANHVLRVIARLKPGVTVADAQRDLRRVASELAATYPREDEGWTTNVFSLRDEIVGDLARPLAILLCASGLVLLIACINVASLQLTRGASRGRELAVRRALGASRPRLVAQLLVESAVLAALGTALGVGLGVLGMRALVAVAPQGISRLDEVSLDGRVFLFALAVAVLTSVLFGLWPAWRVSNPAVSGALRDARGNAGAPNGGRARGALVVAELSLALMLLAGAALVMQSFRKVLSLDLGIRTDHAVVMRLTLGGKYTDSTVTAFHRELQRRLATTPGITAAGASDRSPVQGGGIGTDIRLIERPEANVSGTLMSAVAVVVPGYFRAMGIRLLRGRDIEWTEAGGVVMVNAAAASRFWPDMDPLGKHVAFGRRSNDTGYTVVGIVSDVRRGDITAPEDPMVYVPLASVPSFGRTMSVIVRGSSGTAETVAAAKHAVRELDPTLPVYDIRTIDDIVADTVAQPRLNTTLLASFAALALLLAIIGVYGVVSYTVAQRRQELGVRMALGAQPADIFRFVVRQGTRLAIAGGAIGLLGAWFLTPVLRSWLYEVQPTDLPTFAGVAALLVVVTILATAIPARRATKVDPVVAMRAE